MPKKSLTIAHISDFHTGSQYFIPNLMSRTIEELNQLDPDIVVVTGDITDFGFEQEYKTAETFFSLLKCERRVLVPGNHDSRNVGYLHFEEAFGARNSVLEYQGIRIIGTDSSEPDLDNGRIGRERYRWMEEQFADPEEYKVFALHHHLLPVPGTGRERNIVYDAGDLLEVLLKCGVDLVLCGHKHVPYVWRLESLIVVNAGTAASLRLRGRTKPCYNIISLGEDRVEISRKYPYGQKERIAEFSCSEHSSRHWERMGVEAPPGVVADR
ncbi:MAG: metallophosphoesterase [Chloroflexi bacterium]|nr:metallophosphoesterase [Chloroflexota bacterium]